MHYLGAQSARNAIFFLHGYTQSGSDAKSMVKHIFTKQLLKNHSLVVYFPGRHWFTYKNVVDFDYNETELEKSQSYLYELVKKQTNLEYVGFIGYSQGACMAMDVFVQQLQASKKPIPTMLISGFNAGYTNTSPITRKMFSVTRQYLWTIHGTNDTIIPLDFAHRSYSNYTDNNCILYNEDHWGFWENSKTIQTLRNFVKYHFNIASNTTLLNHS